MGRQIDSKLVGTIRNLIFYNHQGDYRMHLKPESVRRSPASVRSGLNFGKASKLSRSVRSQIAPINPSSNDSHSANLFTGALSKFINWQEKQGALPPALQKELPFISGFQFNVEANLSSIHAVRVSVNTAESGSLEFRFAPFVPTEALHASFYTDHIVFKIIMIAVNLSDLTSEKLSTTEYKIPCTSETFKPSVILLPVEKVSGKLTMMVIAVQYMVKRKNVTQVITDMKKQPCGVVWAGWL